MDTVEIQNNPEIPSGIDPKLQEPASEPKQTVESPSNDENVLNEKQEVTVEVVLDDVELKKDCPSYLAIPNWKLVGIHLLIIVIQVVWGTFAFTTNYTVMEGSIVAPIIFSTLRYWISLPFTFALALIESRSLKLLLPESKMETLHYFIMGIFVVLNQSIYIVGLSSTSGSNAAVIGSLLPGSTMIFSIILRREGFHILKLIGTMVSIGGVVIILNPFTMTLDSSTKGNLMIFSQVFLFAIFICYSNYLCTKYPSQRVSSMSFLIGSILILAFSLVWPGIDAWKQLPYYKWSDWASIIYAAIFATSFTYGATNFVLQYTTPIVVTAYEPLQPLSAEILEILFLNKPLQWTFPVGFVAIAFGLLCVLWGRKSEVDNAELAQQKMAETPYENTDIESTSNIDLREDESPVQNIAEAA